MLSIPRLQLHLTERCNLACRYCYALPASTANDMSPETGSRAIEFYLDHLSDDLSQVTVSFFGGEPLLKFSLIRKLVPYAAVEGARRGKDVRFSITTNGTGIGAEVAAFLRGHNFATLISWDGSPATQDLFRVLGNGGGSSRLMTRALPHIRTLPDVGVRLTWSRETLPRLAANVRYFVDLGFDWVGFAPLDFLSFDEDLLAEYDCQVRSIVDLWCGEISRGRVLYLQPLLAMMTRVMDPRAPLHFHMHGCDPLGGRISVACDGTLFPCHRFLTRTDFPAGNVRSGRLDPAVIETFGRFNTSGLDGCLALLELEVGGEKPSTTPGLMRMMEVTLGGSRAMLRRGAAILQAHDPESLPPEARVMLTRYRTWRGEIQPAEASDHG